MMTQTQMQSTCKSQKRDQQQERQQGQAAGTTNAFVPYNCTGFALSEVQDGLEAAG
jgi:hypothetical protein